MSQCIYTGAYVAFDEYGNYAPADVFACGDQVLVQWMPEGLTYEAERAVTHRVRIGQGYHHDKRGVTVVPAANVSTTPEARR